MSDYNLKTEQFNDFILRSQDTLPNRMHVFAIPDTFNGKWLDFSGFDAHVNNRYGFFLTMEI